MIATVENNGGNPWVADKIMNVIGISNTISYAQEKFVNKYENYACSKIHEVTLLIKGYIHDIDNIEDPRIVGLLSDLVELQPLLILDQHRRLHSLKNLMSALSELNEAYLELISVLEVRAENHYSYLVSEPSFTEGWEDPVNDFMDDL